MVSHLKCAEERCGEIIDWFTSLCTPGSTPTVQGEKLEITRSNRKKFQTFLRNLHTHDAGLFSGVAIIYSAAHCPTRCFVSAVLDILSLPLGRKSSDIAGNADEAEDPERCALFAKCYAFLIAFVTNSPESQMAVSSRANILENQSKKRKVHVPELIAAHPRGGGGGFAWTQPRICPCITYLHDDS